MTIPFLRRKSTDMQTRRRTFSVGVALSYSLFLFVCLVLGIALYNSSAANARENYWKQQAASFERDIATFEGDMAAIDRYTRQLLIDSTFIRFVGMEGIHQRGFVYTAYEVMQSLTKRLYSISSFPIQDSRAFIYLRNCDYIISASQFTEARQFYNSWRSYVPGGFEAWKDLLLTTSSQGLCVDISSFTGKANDVMYVSDLDTFMNLKLPAVIYYEVDMNALRSHFLPEEANGKAIMQVTDSQNQRQMLLTFGAALPAFDGAALDANGTERVNDYMLIHRSGEHKDWQYTIALPESMCDAALGNYDFAFWLIMLMALVGGAVVIAQFVRYNMRPIHLLDIRLKAAQQEMETQKPMLETSYLRKLISGHVTTNEEFDYMLDFLGLHSGQQFYVLYCVAHRQDSASSAPAQEYELIDQGLRTYLHNGHPLYYYTTLEGSFVVLVTYDAEIVDPLMDLQRRVLKLHDDLSENHALWFYAGVGMRCTQAQNIWESYEQARRAARYTAKHHIFLPYEVMRKDADSFFYPVEISSKLQHFITSGNAQQTTEMFALIRRENLEERKLPIAMLNFLLSDLKNTLLKARFQADVKTPENQARVNLVDERLYGQATLPLLESTALLLCECFSRAVDPTDPVAEIQTYLAENFTDPSMCLSKLSDQFHISESYLSHLFKNKTGQNFSVYLETLRLDEAVRRLKGDHVNLSALYSELGYNNPTTFRRAFKKRYGITPSEMRG